MRTSGPSSRLHEALDKVGYVPKYKGRNVAFAEEFGISSATVGRILNSDIVPASIPLRNAIAARANIDIPYWVFGVMTPGVSDEGLVEVFQACTQTVLKKARSRGYSIDNAPTPLVLRIIKMLYNHAMENGGAVSDDYANEVITILGDLYE